MTCSQVVSAEEYMGQYPNRQKEARNNKHFIAMWVRISILVDRMREQQMVAGDSMRMDQVTEVCPGGDGWRAACCVHVHCGIGKI